jgi:hypothetical protein
MAGLMLQKNRDWKFAAATVCRNQFGHHWDADASKSASNTIPALIATIPTPNSPPNSRAVKGFITP